MSTRSEGEPLRDRDEIRAPGYNADGDCGAGARVPVAGTARVAVRVRDVGYGGEHGQIRADQDGRPSGARVRFGDVARHVRMPTDAGRPGRRQPDRSRCRVRFAGARGSRAPVRRRRRLRRLAEQGRRHSAPDVPERVRERPDRAERAEAAGLRQPAGRQLADSAGEQNLGR